MEDVNYKIGAIETKMTDISEDVSELKENLSAVQADVKEIKDQLNTWKASATGAIFVLSIVGTFILWLGDGLVQIIRTKLGL